MTYRLRTRAQPRTVSKQPFLAFLRDSPNSVGIPVSLSFFLKTLAFKSWLSLQYTSSAKSTPPCACYALFFLPEECVREREAVLRYSSSSGSR